VKDIRYLKYFLQMYNHIKIYEDAILCNDYDLISCFEHISHNEKRDCWIEDFLILYLNNYSYSQIEKNKHEDYYVEKGLEILKSVCDKYDNKICHHILKFIE